jgi:hypothetical protein
MMKLEIYRIELVARIVDHNDVGDKSSRLLTLVKVFNEHNVKCVIMLMQPSQESHYDTEADEPLLLEVMK